MVIEYSPCNYLIHIPIMYYDLSNFFIKTTVEDKETHEVRSSVEYYFIEEVNIKSL